LRKRALARQSKPSSSGKLDEGATFSDVHSVVLDPLAKLPYSEEFVKQHVEKTSKEILKERNKSKFGNRKKASNVIVFDHIPLADQIVCLFPGQGAQYVGMGSKLVDCPKAKAVFDRSSEILGYDMFKLCTEGPKTKLDQTLYCQPAVFVSSMASIEKFKASDETIADRITDAAGFSVGEFAALVTGGIIGFDDALRVVDARAKAMHECNQLVRSGMLTIRVNASSRLNEAIEKGEMDVCEVANFLFCGVRVVGANETCMRFLEENQERYNFKVLKRLEVSGAFHTRQMEQAVAKVREAMANVEIQKARCNVYSNYTGHIYPARNSEIRAVIAKQVTNPVKWEQIQQLLYRKHRDYVFPMFVELGPGRQLGAMLMQTSKKAYKNYQHFGC
uniref:PKS_AT domain-containing protein n=1 Tax=Angiostrongylus costaricensis TaxID=334426 RepID=A0A0R3PZ59_ANGCS